MVPGVARPRNAASGSKREAAGDQFQAEQDDHDEPDREDQRADDGLAGLHGGADRQAGGEAEQRAGQAAANQQIERTKPGFGDAGLDHVGDNVGRFEGIHVQRSSIIPVFQASPMPA